MYSFFVVVSYDIYYSKNSNSNTTASINTNIDTSNTNKHIVTPTHRYTNTNTYNILYINNQQYQKQQEIPKGSMDHVFTECDETFSLSTGDVTSLPGSILHAVKLQNDGCSRNISQNSLQKNLSL
jgi:hypothetical protein